MLVKATLEDIKEYGEKIFEIAVNPKKSSYPIYFDGIKTKEDFFKAAECAVLQENEEILLFVENKNVEGWISYFWIEEDHYLQLSSCNINCFYRQALMELMDYLNERFKGFTLYFGYPNENKEALQFLHEQNFACTESNWNHSFFFEHYAVSKIPNNNIERISKENFELFKKAYHPDEEVYWNCERIYENLDKWIVFVYKQNDEILGTVFLTGKNEYFEIFGVEIADIEIKDAVYLQLLSAALNECKIKKGKALTYFCPDKEKEFLNQLGFKCIGQYLLYIKAI